MAGRAGGPPRRALLAGLPLAGLAAAAPAPARAADSGRGEALARALRAIEDRHGGRLGVAVQSGADARPASHRGGERFALCSTFKVLAAAFVLARVDRGLESLDRRVRYGRDQLVPYSPATEPRAGGEGMTVGEICAAAVALSDNTAGNLMLDGFGGPAALTAHLRALGDGTTRLDRREPELNDVPPGDERDTTTPLAMLGLLRATVLGEAPPGEGLSSASRARLAAWLEGSRTGGARLRAGVPAGWRVGDKTGSGPDNATHDVAVLWPPAGPPVVVAAYYAGARATPAQRDAVLAEVGRLAAGA